MKTAFSLVLLAIFLPIDSGKAEVKMPAIFGDHMVLQQNAKLPVWGWAEPGEKVSVTFAGQTQSAEAGSDGKWLVNLNPLPKNSGSQTLVVEGKNKLSFEDVVVGDVWVASGQSNMEWGIKDKKMYADDVSKAADPLLRLFWVPKTTSLEPLNDLLPWPLGYAGETAATTAEVPADPYRGKWLVCTPENLSMVNRQGFSCVAYFFARDIRKIEGSPIGMIQAAWGATRAEAWTSLSGLRKDPPFTNYVQRQEKTVADFPALQETYPQRKAAYDAALKQWTEEVEKPWNKVRDEWKKTVKEAKAAGQPLPPEPVPATPRPSNVHPPDNDTNTPANLFNAMISPLIPFGIKGVIWYQGEFNSGYESGREYVTLFPRMITDWREKWNQGDFPFLFVQLHGFGAPAQVPSEPSGKYPWVREAQFKTLSLPHTGMASAVDLGNSANPDDNHPPDKKDVGLRLAQTARHVAYGEDIVFSGPLYESMKVEGNKIRITFLHYGSGLTLGVSPYNPTDQPFPAPTELKGFGIAGKDQKFVWAQAVIEGNTVLVSSDQVPDPVSVRYNWADYPIGNLYNNEGFPASPFRTDDWSSPPPPQK